MPSALSLLRSLCPPAHVRHVYERLLGTEVEVQVVADSRRRADEAEGAALAEIERLTAVLNRFDPDSELRRWLARPDDRTVIGADLEAVLRLADHWRQVSGGAFHPGADALGALWAAAARNRSLPDPAALGRLVHDLCADPWTLHGDGSATLHARYPLGLNALAKGYIVDRAAHAAAAVPGVREVLVNAGGDLRTAGPRGVVVAVADPRSRRDDLPPMARVRVTDAALASSGNAHRGVDIAGHWHSHVIDPRSGRPVSGTAGVTVVAPDCATADALATVAGVLDVPAALTVIDRQVGCAALIVTDTGHIHSSAGWAALTSG
ncbi:FAD:protein FMN transferase [uncultured Deinococcus sp.]|uniref:FAD:protein FMN transferase n=1 Tax=uncultured Deinococcus sp. TaxID=158789 RepID=UPI0025F6C0F6|nr:FAD:protein FMN transferase [uncultured Deinococcus sp.]